MILSKILILILILAEIGLHYERAHEIVDLLSNSDKVNGWLCKMQNVIDYDFTL